jgi:hypothetical protein
MFNVPWQSSLKLVEGQGNKNQFKAEAALRTALLMKSVTKIVIRLPAEVC